MGESESSFAIFANPKEGRNSKFVAFSMEMSRRNRPRNSLIANTLMHCARSTQPRTSETYRRHFWCAKEYFSTK